MFLGSVLHGALWICNHLQYGIKVIGQQKETSGIAALGLLGVIVLSSLSPIRRLCYELFHAIQCAASLLSVMQISIYSYIAYSHSWLSL